VADLKRSAKTMKEIAQTFLIIGGGLGLLGAVPAAIYGWFVHRGFGGDLTNKDRLILIGPFLCLAAIVIGLAWRKSQTKKSVHGRFKLTEDGGAAGDVGGFE
jgi:hypothetical protein